MIFSPEEVRRINEHQRAVFNRLVEVFDQPQPADVMARLGRIVAAAGIAPGEVVLDVGTGVGVLIPLIRRYRPGRIIACDLAENMLARVRTTYPEVETHQADVAVLELPDASVDVTLFNAVYGNIADKPATHRNVARFLRAGGRMVVSHPEGRRFVAHLVETSDLFIERLPTRDEFRAALAPVGLRVERFVDRRKLYLMVARKGEA
jgi:ubiquinone/menaquinone biosynthesis C-methylase UbiE